MGPAALGRDEAIQTLERALFGPSALPVRDWRAAEARVPANLVTRSSRTKRAFDFTVALFAIVLVAPMMLMVAALIKLDSAGPVLFRQQRRGRGMRPFQMLKFRTMAADAPTTVHEQFIARLATEETAEEEPLKKLVDDPRVTRVGAVLRRLSLDELPQLFNVLAGHMSLVGPRPAIDYEIEHYRPDHFARFEVRPGLTGLWQVSGRSKLGFIDMLELDVEYAQGGGALTDLRILMLTPRAAIGRTA